jgi:hypothetical protein
LRHACAAAAACTRATQPAQRRCPGAGGGARPTWCACARRTRVSTLALNADSVGRALTRCVATRAPAETHAPQIRFILLQNRQGRTRLAKYYVPLDDNEKRKLEFDIHRLVVNRDPKFTNFLEARPRVSSRALPAQRSAGCRGCCAAHALCRVPWRGRMRRARGAARGARTPALCANPKACLFEHAQFRTHKVIYRRYAGLFFSMCVDTSGACRPRPHVGAPR